MSFVDSVIRYPTRDYGSLSSIQLEKSDFWNVWWNHWCWWTSRCLH